MSINFKADVYSTMITNFAKTISHIPRTKVVDNITGDETLTDGSPVNISGAFYRKEDEWAVDKGVNLQGADAILMVLPAVTINREDKLTYDGENYRIDTVVERRLGTTAFYNMARCFKI